MRERLARLGASTEYRRVARLWSWWGWVEDHVGRVVLLVTVGALALTAGQYAWGRYVSAWPSYVLYMTTLVTLGVGALLALSIFAISRVPTVINNVTTNVLPVPLPGPFADDRDGVWFTRIPYRQATGGVGWSGVQWMCRTHRTIELQWADRVATREIPDQYRPDEFIRLLRCAGPTADEAHTIEYEGEAIDFWDSREDAARKLDGDVRSWRLEQG